MTRTVKWLCDGKRQNGQFGNQWIKVKAGDVTEGFPDDQLYRLKEGVHYEIVDGKAPKAKAEAKAPEKPFRDFKVEAEDEPKPKRKGKRKIVKSEE